MDYTHITNAHPAFIDNLYQKFKQDPLSVPEGWREFFAGFEYAAGQPLSTESTDGEGAFNTKELAVVNLIQAYRLRGHLLSETNPIRVRKFRFPSLDLAYFGLSDADLSQRFAASSEIGLQKATLSEIIDRLKIVYCGSIGFEFAHIDNQDKYQWLKSRIESIRTKGDYGFGIDKKKRILEKLNGATGFENFLGKKYVAQKKIWIGGW
jgi:2-oxoglutarate dehydrogenase E1 component